MDDDLSVCGCRRSGIQPRQVFTATSATPSRRSALSPKVLRCPELSPSGTRWRVRQWAVQRKLGTRPTLRRARPTVIGLSSTAFLPVGEVIDVPLSARRDLPRRGRARVRAEPAARALRCYEPIRPRLRLAFPELARTTNRDQPPAAPYPPIVRVTEPPQASGGRRRSARPTHSQRSSRRSKQHTEPRLCLPHSGDSSLPGRV